MDCIAWLLGFITCRKLSNYGEGLSYENMAVYLLLLQDFYFTAFSSLIAKKLKKFLFMVLFIDYFKRWTSKIF